LLREREREKDLGGKSIGGGKKKPREQSLPALMVEKNGEKETGAAGRGVAETKNREDGAVSTVQRKLVVAGRPAGYVD